MNITLLGIDPFEWIFILILVLLVFGPEDIPSLLRMLGGWLRQLRVTLVGLSGEFGEELGSIQDVIRGRETQGSQSAREERRDLEELLRQLRR